jgi:transposase-like protein
MIGRETRMLLKHYLEQGASKSALARQLGVSRDTVHRWIRAGDLDRDLDTTPVRYRRRPLASCKQDPSGRRVGIARVSGLLVGAGCL